MALTGPSGEELVSGCPAPDYYEYEFGPSDAQVKKIADQIMEDTRRYGGAPPSDGAKPGPRRDQHLDGYGDPRSV